MMGSTLMPPLPMPRWVPQRRDARGFVSHEYAEKDSAWFCLDANRSAGWDPESSKSAYSRWANSVKNAARMVFGFLL